jgi:hypothetical protein
MAEKLEVDTAAGESEKRLAKLAACLRDAPRADIAGRIAPLAVQTDHCRNP